MGDMFHGLGYATAKTAGGASRRATILRFIFKRY
jgi:hypothetical protein